MMRDISPCLSINCRATTKAIPPRLASFSGSKGLDPSRDVDWWSIRVYQRGFKIRPESNYSLIASQTRLRWVISSRYNV